MKSAMALKNTVREPKFGERREGFVRSIQVISPRHGRPFLFFLLAALSACATIPPGTVLDPAVPSRDRLSVIAWIGPVRILDPSVENRQSVEDSLQSSVAGFVRETRDFSAVDTVPGDVDEGDVILDFQFDRFEQQRNTHPAYYTAAILSLTLYTWLGGPIYHDVSDLAGTLTVKDHGGRELAVVNAQVTEERNVSLWSRDYSLPLGVEARTSLMQQLLDKARTSLSGRAIGRLPGES